jgi:hypothetical protein
MRASNLTYEITDDLGWVVYWLNQYLLCIDRKCSLTSLNLEANGMDGFVFEALLLDVYMRAVGKVRGLASVCYC